MTSKELLAVLLERREATKEARNEARAHNRRLAEASRIEKKAYTEWMAAFLAENE